MARAYGSSATLLLKRETAYGQAASGDYIRMPCQYRLKTRPVCWRKTPPVA
jgi:hypothetical protein